MKKSNTSVAETRELAELNRLYRQLSRLSVRFAEAYRAADDDATMHDLSEKCRVLSAHFDELRGRIPRVKFDMVSGKYFFAERGGEEWYAVKVSRTDSAVLSVPARSEGEAEDRAKMEYARRCNVPLALLEAEVVSR